MERERDCPKQSTGEHRKSQPSASAKLGRPPDPHDPGNTRGSTGLLVVWSPVRVGPPSPCAPPHQRAHAAAPCMSNAFALHSPTDCKDCGCQQCGAAELATGYPERIVLGTAPAGSGSHTWRWGNGRLQWTRRWRTSLRASRAKASRVANARAAALALRLAAPASDLLKRAPPCESVSGDRPLSDHVGVDNLKRPRDRQGDPLNVVRSRRNSLVVASRRTPLGRKSSQHPDRPDGQCGMMPHPFGCPKKVCTLRRLMHSMGEIAKGPL